MCGAAAGILTPEDSTSASASAADGTGADLGHTIARAAAREQAEFGAEGGAATGEGPSAEWLDVVAANCGVSPEVLSGWADSLRNACASNEVRPLHSNVMGSPTPAVPHLRRDSAHPSHTCSSEHAPAARLPCDATSCQAARAAVPQP
jgi:hypothetical protein